jgi:hypothetical protein
MPLSFPASPTVGQTSTQNGRTYSWTGYAWELVPASGGGLSWSSVPASATATGTAGQIAYDGSYFYVASATNTWVRAALSTWVPFYPTSVAGLYAWYDASDASTLYDATSGGSLVAADGAVARWQDKSGSARHATQGTSGNRPLRKAGVQNGLGTLRFDGSDDLLQVPDSAVDVGFLHQSGYSIFAVFRAGPNVLSPIVTTLSTFGGNPGIILYHDHRQAVRPDGEIGSTVNIAANATMGYATTGGTFPANTFKVVSVVGDISSGTAASRGRIYANGTLAASNSSTQSAGSSSTAQSNLTIGAASAQFFALGDIGELVIYSAALSDQDRALVEGYLRTKWGIA